jgi:hypothetical protein
LLRGTVRAAGTHEPLAGVAVFLKGENRSATTDTAGNFSLLLPARRPRAGRALVLHYTGYQSSVVPVATTATATMQLELHADPAAAGATIVGYYAPVRYELVGGISYMGNTPLPKPAAAYPRSFWRWLTQPFRPKS